MLTAGIVSRISGSNLVAMPMAGMAKTVSGISPRPCLRLEWPARISYGSQPSWHMHYGWNGHTPSVESAPHTMPTAGMVISASGTSTGMPTAGMITQVSGSNLIGSRLGGSSSKPAISRPMGVSIIILVLLIIVPVIRHHPQSPNIAPNSSGYSHNTTIPAGQTGEQPGFRHPDASGNAPLPHGQSPSGVI